MTERYFNQEEICLAKNYLRILAEISARFWAKAFLSEDFMYKGKVGYIDVGYKSGQWKDYPATEKEEISAEQIMTFIDTYVQECEKSIKRYVEGDREVAYILGVTSEEIRANPRFRQDRTKIIVDLNYGLKDFSFGGWDNDPTNEVAKAKKAAGLEGAMRVNSKYRKTHIDLRDGEVYVRKGGIRKNICNLNE